MGLSYIALRENYPNKEFFQVRFFPHLEWIRRQIYGVNLRIQSKYGKIRTRKNSVFGQYFTQCCLYRDSPTLIPLLTHCMKSVQIPIFFWSVFSCIRTEYGETLRISPYSVRMRENTDQKKLYICTHFTQ